MTEGLMVLVIVVAGLVCGACLVLVALWLLRRQEDKARKALTAWFIDTLHRPHLLLALVVVLLCAGCAMGVRCTRTVRYAVDAAGRVTVETEYREEYGRGPFPKGGAPTTYLQRAETWLSEFERQAGREVTP